MISHHLDDATVLSFASGTLDEAFSVVAASHVALCGVCRRSVHAAETIGGSLLEEMSGADLDDRALDRIMRAIGDENGPGPARAGTPAFTPPAGDVPVPLIPLVGPSLSKLRWRRIGPGIRKHAIDLGPQSASSLYMLEIAPGKAVPEHGHGGAEITLILAGAYRDHLGRFGTGDVADLDEQVEHQPKVEIEAACICLVATERPTRFKSLVNRALQPLHGI